LFLLPLLLPTKIIPYTETLPDVSSLLGAARLVCECEDEGSAGGAALILTFTPIKLALIIGLNACIF
jgi:hypothetical protein